MQSEKLMLEAVRSRLQSLMENLEQSLAGVESYSLTMPTQFSLRSHWTKFGVTGEGLDEMLEALPREERNNCETAWECLKALFVTDPEVDMREIENRRDYLIPHSCDWAVKQASDYLENPSFNRLWIYGEPGKGKTHIALALGLAACQRGHRVRFTTTAALVSELIEARDEKKLLRFQKQIASYELLIVDELGFVPLSKTGAELLFEMLSQRYERGSTLVTSNLPFQEWTEVLGSERLTGALLDRLTHHVHERRQLPPQAEPPQTDPILPTLNTATSEPTSG